MYTRVFSWVAFAAVLPAMGLVSACSSSGSGGGGGTCEANIERSAAPCPQTGTACEASGGIAVATCQANGTWPPVSACKCMASLTCGNGTLEAGEMCDGMAFLGLPNNQCSNMIAGTVGMITCNADCGGMNTSGCVAGAPVAGAGGSAGTSP